MISGNPSVSPGIADCSRDTLETISKTFIIPADRNSSFNKTFLTMLQFSEMPLHRIGILNLLDRTLKVHSGINNLIQNKLEHCEEVSQS